MHWTDRRRGKTNLGEALQRRGWTLYGYTPDHSEPLADYHSPASWDGIAEKDGCVVVVDVAPGSSVLKWSGGRPRSERVKDKDCERCGGSGQEPDGWSYERALADTQGYRRWILATKGVVMAPVIGAIVDARDFKDGRYRCGQCYGSGYTWKEITVTEPWPTFRGNPIHKVWHVERSGAILGSGNGLSGWADYDQRQREVAIAQTVQAIEYQARRADRPGAGGNNSGAAPANGVRIRRNESHNGIEVIFPAKPSYETRQSLKDLRFRWSSAQGLWYARYSETTWRRVHDLLGVQPAGENPNPAVEQEDLEQAPGDESPCPPDAAERGCAHEQGCTDEIKDRHDCPFPRQFAADAGAVPAYPIVEPLTGEEIGSNGAHGRAGTPCDELAEPAGEDWGPDGRPAAVQAYDYVPDRIRSRIPKLYCMDGKPHDQIIVWLKFFTPDSSWSWFAWEYDGEDVFFGLVIGQEMEVGYWSLAEMRETTGPMGLRIERDIWWQPQPLCQIPEYAQWSGADPGLRAKCCVPKPAHDSTPECGLLPARPTIARTNRSLQGGDDAWLKIVVRPKPDCSIPVVIWQAMAARRYEWEAAREAWTTGYDERAWDELLAAETAWLRLERAAAEAAETHVALTPEMIRAAAADEGPSQDENQPTEPAPPEPEPWEMGQRGYMLGRAMCAGGVPICNAADREVHETAVRQASAQGLPVPPDVLDEYDLAVEDILEVLDVYGRTYRVSRHDYLQPDWTQVRLYALKRDVLLGRLPEDDPEYKPVQTVTLARENIARVLTPLPGVDPAPDPAKAAAAEEQAGKDVTIGEVRFTHFSTSGGHLEYTCILDGVGWTVFRVTPRPEIAAGAKPWWVAEVHRDERVRCLNSMVVREDKTQVKDPLYDETDDGERDPPMKLLAGMARLIVDGYEPFAPEPVAGEPSDEPAAEAPSEPSAASGAGVVETAQEPRNTLASPAPAAESLAVELPDAAPASGQAAVPPAAPAWTVLTPLKWKNGWPVAAAGTIHVRDNTGQVHLVTPFPPRMWCMTCRSNTCPAGQAILDGKPATKQQRTKAA